MKRIVCRLSLVAASVMLLSLTARSEEGIMSSGDTMGETGVKNECLLVAKNCPTDSIQERIDRVTNEINKGTSVYTKDELDKLQRQLDDYNKEFLFLHDERTPTVL